MNDPELHDFENWFKDQLTQTLAEDEDFTRKILSKIEATQRDEVIESDTWTNLSWLVCMISVATLLLQSLSQIETETLSGPVLQSLGLVGVLWLVSWQWQSKWLREFE